MTALPEKEIHLRIKNLQRVMAQNGFDGALVIQRVDLYYLSGTGQDAHLFIPTEGEPVLFVRKSLERAMDETPLGEVRSLKSLSELKKQLLSTHHGRLGTLGMELDVLPVNNYLVYKELFPRTAIVDISPLIREARMIKSEYELDMIGQAARMNDGLFTSVAETLREGMTEVEFAGLLEARYRKNGHQGYVRVRSFNQEIFYGHIMSGANLAVPSCSVGPTGGLGVNPSLPHSAGRKAIGRHEPIQVDYVGVVGGYIVDQARTFFLGEPAPEYINVHEVALTIQQALIEQGRPGVWAEKLYETAIRIATEAGLGKCFMGHPQPVPFVGHGLGLELDELPLVGRKSPHVLKSGMVIALEPKFILPGKGLAGIENTFVVGKKKLQKLTLFDDALQILS